ncbi:hypothetical protein SELMODRAFT_403467 [Selaginella moellendorffii]|uniref:Uncharacterized protein n=1 Tax=Selaginella moellendorffii TaxID=88036 RepID=D8QRI1_SELML|nr:hypothetical protein SELMODRAFT_403467 [Selaginella moellendorffii]
MDVKSYAEFLERFCREEVVRLTSNQGPVSVESGLRQEEFMRIYNETDAHKRSMLFMKDQGELLLQYDFSAFHEQVRIFWFIQLCKALTKVGLQFEGRERLVQIGPGGLVELNDRLQQVDFIVLERSSQEPTFQNARVAIVGQVVYANECIDKVVNDLDAVTSAANGGAKLGIVIFVRPTVEEPLVVWIKERGLETQRVEVSDGAVRLDWFKLFDEAEIRSQIIPPGNSEISMAAAADFIRGI